ncbi:MAG: hypothetical protein QXX35_02095 [Desulfurococcaceae archaeon]
MNTLEERIIVIRIGLIILIVLFIVSFIIHMPITVQKTVFNKILIEPVYIDIVYDDYNSILVNPCRGVESRKWFNKTLLDQYCRGEYYLLIPYRDYDYKYGFLNGLLWYVIIQTTRLLTPDTGYKPVYSSEVSYTIFYTLYSIVIFFSTIVFYIYLNKIYRVLGVENIVLKTSSILLSSLFIYMIYSWEFIHFTILVLTIYYYLLDKYSYFYLFLGLFTCFNPIGFTLIFFTIYNGLHSDLFVLDKRISYLIIGLTPLYLQTILSPISVYKQFTWFMIDYCNNCLYLLFTNNPFSQVTRGLAVVFFTIVFTIYLVLKPVNSNTLYRYAYIVLFISIIISFNLVFTPQTLLLILSLLPPLYSIYNSFKPIISHYVLDILNSLVIITWFRDIELRRTLSFLGISIQNNPLSIESPVQWITQSRNITLIIITLVLTINYLKIQNNYTKVFKQQ